MIYTAKHKNINFNKLYYSFKNKHYNFKTTFILSKNIQIYKFYNNILK